MARALGDLVFIWMQPEYNQLSHVCYCKETHGSQSVCIYWSDGRLDCLEAGCLPPVSQRLRELHTQPLANQLVTAAFCNWLLKEKNICATTDKPLMPFLLHSYWNYGNINKNKTAWGQQPRKTDHLQISGERRALKEWLLIVFGCAKSLGTFFTPLWDFNIHKYFLRISRHTSESVC